MKLIKHIQVEPWCKSSAHIDGILDSSLRERIVDIFLKLYFISEFSHQIEL